MNTKKIRVYPKKLAVASPKLSKSLYDKDFYAWGKEQSRLILDKRWDKVDIQNIAEEIESLSKSQKTALKSQIKRLLMHMLKLRYQPEMQLDSNSWQRSIDQAREDIEDMITSSPSLKTTVKDLIKLCYPRAVREAAFETFLDIRSFPKECPWTKEEILGIKDKDYDYDN